MNLLSIFTLAVGLAMDATAVAAARGLATPVLRWRHALIVAVFFGGFQAFMPLLGWFLGSSVGPMLSRWDHWIAFVLLGAIGGKMLHEAWEGGDEKPEEGREESLFGLRPMLILAVATSIDAFAVGVTLPMLKAPFALSLATIGITTAVLSALGLVAGRRFGALLGKRLDALGGIVLILLGAKILFDHLTGAA